jgi:hypothetical protein
MSENARRPISLPPRRQQGASTPVQNLLRANRDASVEAEAASSEPQSGPVSAQIPSRKPKGTTIYFPEDFLKRAKAAYKHTNGKEMDHSWSEFINRAVMIEVERRERLYNEGNPFKGGDERLAPGRKVQY